MHAVIVDGDISYPPTSGKRLRTLNLLLPLAKRHRLTYIGRGDAKSAEAKQAVAFLEDHGIRTLLVDHPLARKSGPLFYARLAANLLSPLPYSVASHRSAKMREAVNAYAAAHKVDVWQFEWTGYVDTLRASQREEGRHRPQRRYAHLAALRGNGEEHAETSLHRQQRHKFERFERRVFHEATRVVAVSDADARLMREQFGVENPDVVDNGIDRAFFEQVQRRPDPKRILFLGALDWRPNLDALKLLLDDIMPRVRQQEANAKLCIVGRQSAGVAARTNARQSRRRVACRRSGCAAVSGRVRRDDGSAAHRRRLAAEDSRSAGVERAGHLDARRRRRFAPDAGPRLRIGRRRRTDGGGAGRQHPPSGAASGDGGERPCCRPRALRLEWLGRQARTGMGIVRSSSCQSSTLARLIAADVLIALTA